MTGFHLVGRHIGLYAVDSEMAVENALPSLFPGVREAQLKHHIVQTPFQSAE